LITKILIADDEQAPRNSLRDALIQIWPQANLVAQCIHGTDAWDSFLEHEPDVCFLDIKMPGMNGFSVAKKILALQPSCAIVFCTAYGEFALEAFETGAIDYLLKPIDTNRLSKTIERVKFKSVSKSDDRHLVAFIDKALAQSKARKMPAHVQATVGKEIRLIPVGDILFFESDSRYTRLVYRLDNNPNGAIGEALIRTPLKELIADLDGDVFWQIHRSTIVNSQFIRSAIRVDDGVMHLSMQHYEKAISVSRQFQGLFKGR
jgi:DNA-binding LytR/AlgR family response regulator